MRPINKPWFSFNGIKNTDVGALMVSMPTRQTAVKQGDKTVINGKDGFMFVSKDSYGAVAVKQEIAVLNSDDINAVDAWLNGSGELIFFDQPNMAYDAYVLTSYQKESIAKRLDGVKITVQFTCQPFRHEVNPETIEMSISGDFLGRGNVKAKPRVTVEGSGSCELTINGDTMFLELTSGTPITIDYDAKIVYSRDKDGVMYFNGTCVSFKEQSGWAELNPNAENNRIEFTSGITKVTIEPEWRWL